MPAEEPASLAIVDAVGTLAERVEPVLRRAGYGVEWVRVADDLRSPNGSDIRLVLLDCCSIGPGGVPRAILRIREAVTAPILQISGCRAMHDVCRTHPTRADAFLVRPVGTEELLDQVSQLLHPADGPPTFHGMVGRSALMRDLFRTIRRVGPRECGVLIRGETGTGKELVARALHALSPRARGPFVTVDCGALPDSLIESEFFGHVRGAFTGAVRNKPGLFQASSGGTLFLDEVGNMSPHAQARLLRALEEKAVKPLGENRTTRYNSRILAATRQDPGALVGTGSFREDLYYRLNGFLIDVPPLSQRAGDVDDLIDYDLRRRGPGLGGNGVPPVSPAARAMLRAYSWPGNVRELFSVLERASIMAEGHTIGVEHLPPHLRESLREANPETYARALDLSKPEGGGPGAIAILEALRSTGGHRGRAAYLLGVSRTTLWRRMRDLGLLPRGS